MSTVRTKKAQARLENIEPREVSPVDRPANGEPFLIVKSEGGVASEEHMPGKTEAKKSGGPPPVSAQMAQGEPPPPPMAEEQKAPPPAAPPAPAQEGTDEVAMVLPKGAKEGLTLALKGAQGRIGQLVMMLEKATEADDAEMPGEPIVMIADVAGALAMAVEPYVAKQAGAGMTPPPPPGTGDAEVGKAEFVPWTQEYIDSLSNWCFLYTEPSTERDTDYRTLPLSSRKFPVRDHAGRLCLPMVLQAIEQISAGTSPFLSPQKKRRILIDLAKDRLYEISIAAERDEPMQPETAAELLAIAEMIGGLAGMTAAPPALAPAATPAVDAPPPAMGEAAVDQAAPPPAPAEAQMTAFGKACADRIREVAAIGKSVVSKSGVAKLGEVAAALKAVLAKVDEMAAETGEGAEAEKAFPPKTEAGADAEAEKAFPPKKEEGAATETAKSATPAVDVAKALADKDAALAAAQAELARARVDLTKAQQDLSAKSVQLAKAAADLRKVPSSNVAREERADVGKAATAYVPASRDLNEDFDREKQASRAQA